MKQIGNSPVAEVDMSFHVTQGMIGGKRYVPIELRNFRLPEDAG